MSFLWMLSEIRTPIGIQLFQFITYLGQEMLPVIVICALYWCCNKKLATTIGLTYVTSGICVQGLKITFRIPRPWALDSDFQPVESAVGAATGYSFPSGHTQSAVSLFSPLAFAAKRWYLKLLYIILFLSVGFSRMYLGVHTPKDVCTALVITLIIGLLIWKGQAMLNNPKHTLPICIIISALAIFFAFYSFYLYHSGTIEYKYIEDCFKMAGASIGFAMGWYLEKTRLNFSTECSGGKKTLLCRFLVGIFLTLVIYLLPKLIFDSFLIWKFLRYASVIFWIVYGYPCVFTTYQKKMD